MITILLQQVVQADATGIFLLALIASPFIIRAIVRNSKISEAEEIKRKYPDGYRNVMYYSSESISYDTAKRVIEKQYDIARAQREYDEAQRKKAEEKRIKDKAATIRRACPDVCGGKSDDYIANNESSIRSEQRRYEQRKEEAKQIYASYREGVSAICGYISGSFVVASDIDKVVSNKSKIIAEQQRIDKNKAELSKLTPQLTELKKKYPLGVKEIAKEKGWSITNAEDVKLLLLSPGSISERQEREEQAIISSKVKLDPIIKTARDLAEKNSKTLAKSRITTLYGAKVSTKVMETIEAEDKYKSISAFLDSVEKTQNDFASETRSLIPDCFSGWGWYSNKFTVQYTDNIGHSKTNTLKIWQPFCESCCLDDSISYEYHPDYKKNRIYKSQLEGTYSYNEKSWSKVLSFINKLKEKYEEEVFVVLANTDNLCSNSFENNFKTIKEMLSDAGINYGVRVPQNTSRNSNKTYVIVDIITENSNLVKYCEDIFQFRYGSNTEPNQGLTRIVYVSMLRCYDGSEVEELNKKAIKAKEEEARKAREEEERKKREEEQKLKDAQDIVDAKTIARTYPIGFKYYFPEQSTITISAAKAREIKQKKSSIQEHENLLSRLNSGVSGWNAVAGVPHYFFYYYYPTRFTNISSDSQEARRLVYNFKDGIAHNKVKDMVVSKLRNTFSTADLSKMTFVCIPASTIAVNQSRYKDFSREVSQALDMWNGYDYITITKEKTPSHLGGTDSAEYSFDRSFFKDKIVVLFDDIVTRGGSVSSMKSNLESLGAKVICAISIGRTFSDWNGNTPKPHPYTGNV